MLVGGGGGGGVQVGGGGSVAVGGTKTGVDVLSGRLPICVAAGWLLAVGAAVAFTAVPVTGRLDTEMKTSTNWLITQPRWWAAVMTSSQTLSAVRPCRSSTVPEARVARMAPAVPGPARSRRLSLPAATRASPTATAVGEASSAAPAVCGTPTRLM